MSFSPKEKDKFFLGDLDVYIDDETLPAFYTRAEKPIQFTAEFAEFLEGIPQTLVRKDLIRFGMGISLSAMEWTASIFQLARGGTLDASNPSFDKLDYGTDVVEPPIKKFTFVGTRRDDKSIEFVILQGKSTDFPEIPTGGTDYNEIPFTVEALVDESESDTNKNLAYWKFGK